MTIKRITCKRCKGEGTIVKGDPCIPIIFDQTVECPSCYGTGFDSSAEAMDEGING